jgi:hypothetical protein
VVDPAEEVRNVNAVEKVAGAAVAVGLGSFPLWVALFVAEVRSLRRRARALAVEEPRR